MASKKWGIDYSYQSLKNIPDEVIFLDKTITKFIQNFLELSKNCNNSWVKVYRNITNSNSFKSIDVEKLDKILSNLVVKDVEIIRDIPIILKSGNYNIIWSIQRISFI